MLTYAAAHLAAKARRGRASEYGCWGCGKPAEHWAYNDEDPDALVDARGRIFSASVENYIAMCRSCHFSFDTDLGRLHAVAVILDNTCPFCAAAVGKFCRKPNGMRYPASTSSQHGPRRHLVGA